jgi:hypothetical protein
VAPPTAWKKGQSGNPNGRPKKLPEVRARLEECAGDAVELLLEVVTGQLMAEPKDRIAAAKALLDWALPKPQATQASASEAEALEALAKLLEA